MRQKVMSVLSNPWLWIVVMTVITSWSLFRPGLFFVHDYIHAARIAEMTRALQVGHFPVRMAQNFGFGYGMPLFNFYAPLPWYFGSALYWLGLPIELSIKLLVAASTLVTAVGSFGLIKELTKRNFVALTASFLAVTLPYRAVNLYVRGAFAESWGMAFLPLILWGGVRVVERKKYGWLLFAISVAGLILSHNLTALMFLPMAAVFLVVYWILTNYSLFSKQSLRTAAVGVGSGLLGIGLAAFYSIPAYLEKNLTQIDSILGGYFDYNNHFLYIRQFLRPIWEYGGSGWGPDDGISFFFGWGQWLGIFLAVFAVLYWLVVKLRKNPRKLLTKNLTWLSLIVTAAGLLLVSLVLSLARSKPIWDAVAVLEFIQFPWRFLGVAMVWLVVLVSLAISKLPVRILSAVLLVLVVVSSINLIYFRPESLLADTDALYYTDPERIRSQMSQILPDYIYKNYALDWEPPQTFVSHIPQFQNPSDQLDYELKLADPHQYLVSVTLQNPNTAWFAIANYPGWYVELDGTPVITKEQNGVIGVELEAGTHLISFYFGRTPIRQSADFVSAVSVIILLGLIVSQYSNHIWKK